MKQALKIIATIFATMTTVTLTIATISYIGGLLNQHQANVERCEAMSDGHPVSSASDNKCVFDITKREVSVK
jgi:hypothetical protein